MSLHNSQLPGYDIHNTLHIKKKYHGPGLIHSDKANLCIGITASEYGKKLAVTMILRHLAKIHVLGWICGVTIKDREAGATTSKRVNGGSRRGKSHDVIRVGSNTCLLRRETAPIHKTLVLKERNR